MTVELYDPNNPEPEEPSLKESWDYFKKGLTSPEQWQEVARGASRLRENIPSVAETWLRGTVAPAFGGVGDLSELGTTARNKLIDLLPERVANTVRQIDAAQRFYANPAVNLATRNAPTTKQVLERTPRATPKHEGAETMEDVAGFVSPGTAYVGGKLASLTKGMPVGNMFIGRGSPKWDELMELEARRMELEGKSKEEIWRATGNVRGFEGKWKQEIPDNLAQIRDYKLGNPSKTFGELFDNAKNRYSAQQSYVGLDDILKHDKLKEAYPNFFKKEGSDLEVRLMPEGTPITEKGVYYPKQNAIAVNPALSPEEAKSTILHEIQHHIQQKEGFALGGSTKSYQDQSLAVAARDALTIRDYWNRLPADMPNWQKTATIQKFFKDVDYKPHPQAFDFALGDTETRKLSDIAKLYGADKSLSPDTPERMYKHIAGEAESRLTQNRQFLDEQARRDIFPYQENKVIGLDIDPKNAIVHGVNKGEIIKGGEVVRRPGDFPERPDTGIATSTEVAKQQDELGFYSPVKFAVDSIKQDKGTGAQFLAQIQKTPGVKQEELIWTGLDDFLKNKKSVTKAEIDDYLSKNRVQIKETQLGDVKLNENSEYALPEVVDLLKREQGTSYENMRLSLENDYDAYNALTRKFPNLEDTDNWADRVLAELIDTNSGAARFSKFQLPGGTNYREVYLTLPNSKTEEQIAQEMFGKPYDRLMGSAQAQVINKMRENQYVVPRAHSATPEADVNRVVHLRMNDRIDADGKKVLFVEEVQSDWHQAGRKQGYKTPETISKMQKTVDELEAERTQLYAEKERLEKLAEPYTSQGKDAPSDILDKWNTVSNRLNNLSREWSSAKNLLATGGNLIPDAPFKTTWHELGMKRAIKMAAEGNYDRIAFTTGAQQAERYDLSKQVENIQYNQKTKSLFGQDKNGRIVVDEIVEPEKLDEYIGKEAANKLLSDKSIIARTKDGKPFLHELSGQDLQVGGEGMKGFYDQMLPKYLDKYAKKWGVRTSKAKIKLGEDVVEPGMAAPGIDYFGKDKITEAPMAEVHYLDITPRMKESIKKEGQPLFTVAPTIGLGTSEYFERKDKK